jgi:very-short-patch-repair endonuclease
LPAPKTCPDTSAYRRDRRKDALFRENGIHVLRFLAEDLSKRPDPTLDSIFRAIEHLRRPG